MGMAQFHRKTTHTYVRATVRTDPFKLTQADVKYMDVRFTVIGDEDFMNRWKSACASASPSRPIWFSFAKTTVYSNATTPFTLGACLADVTLRACCTS
jgi:hypothetical protein